MLKHEGDFHAIIVCTNKMIKEKFLCIIVQNKKKAGLVSDNYLNYLAKKVCGYPGCSCS